MKQYQLLDAGVWDLTSRKTITPRTTPDEWKLYEEWLTAGGVLLPKDVVGQMTLEEAKDAKMTEINAFAASLRNQVIAGRSSGEMVSWAIKLLDAMAVAGAQPSPFASLLPAIQAALGLPSLPTSYNHAMAMIRGISEAEHVTKVMAQAVPFIAAEAAIDGNRGKHCDAIYACVSLDEIILYDWSTGWPSI